MKQSLKDKWSLVRQQRENLEKFLIIVNTGGIFSFIALVAGFVAADHDKIIHSIVLAPLILFELSLILSGIALFKDLYALCENADNYQDLVEKATNKDPTLGECALIDANTTCPIPLFRNSLIVSSVCSLLGIVVGTIDFIVFF